MANEKNRWPAAATGFFRNLRKSQATPAEEQQVDRWIKIIDEVSREPHAASEPDASEFKFDLTIGRGTIPDTGLAPRDVEARDANPLAPEPAPAGPPLAPAARDHKGPPSQPKRKDGLPDSDDVARTIAEIRRHMSGPAADAAAEVYMRMYKQARRWEK